MNKERLLRLAEHLETGKLSVNEFNMRHWHAVIDLDTCGTAGCAVGECPTVFPADWKFYETSSHDPVPGLRDNNMGAIEDAAFYFDLLDEEANALFMASRGKYRASSNDASRTRYDVARELRKFVELGDVWKAIDAAREPVA